MEIREMRKNDANGKVNAFSIDLNLECDQNQKIKHQTVLAAGSSQQKEKWINMLKDIKQEILN